MTDQPTNSAAPVMLTVCDIQFRNNSKIYFFNPGELTVASGTDVIIETSRGPEYGQCVRGNHSVSEREIVPPLRPVIRIATEQDMRINAENRKKEAHAHQICVQKIEYFKLDMQLVSTEYAFDGSKILFFFTSDGRVDFRELVKSLASTLHSRIELRQIGVRDKAKMVGGLGICGRPFCCREFLDDFQPVSIKMAKTQNLSLNPTKISGTCGRLMCCLNYEQEAYEDLLRSSPKPESFVDTPDGRGTVTDINLLKQSVRVRLEKQPDTVVCHKNCDICVLRNGKARKTDEPIPDDFAPISGNKPKKAPAEPGFSTYLDPVVLRKDASTLAPARESGEPEDGPKDKRQRRRNGKYHKPPMKQAETSKPKQEPAPKPVLKPDAAPKQAPKNPPKQAQKTPKDAAQESAPKPKRNHHRYYHKHRKPNNTKSDG